VLFLLFVAHALLRMLTAFLIPAWLFDLVVGIVFFEID
jgi:hypothetical protein